MVIKHAGARCNFASLSSGQFQYVTVPVFTPALLSRDESEGVASFWSHPVGQSRFCGKKEVFVAKRNVFVAEKMVHLLGLPLCGNGVFKLLCRALRRTRLSNC